ncbi:transposase [Chryseobacterium viscerum]|uniref:Transposase n=1 Tax=Chryseobacterium viscerum TaxID=1037377 RepID=A0A316WBM1_9FLAO|nr:transposase [Chryseobacterium viscerum]PWN58389.1 transposase [Chryseobacterium viscerum]
MDTEIQRLKPDYKLIYSDILQSKYPEKISSCEAMIQKEYLSTLEVIKLNILIFGNSDKQLAKKNQRHRAYDRSDILHILKYQKENRLNNKELALHFRLSRNTVTKWKKLFMVE